MEKRTFKYCATHKEDEAYMQQMCARGWAAERLVEGFWTFRPCRPGQYCYRICYLRGKTKAQVEDLIREYEDRGIQFVSRYSFWAIFRSEQPFSLYSEEEDQEICKKMYAPMPVGAVISWILLALCLVLSWKISLWFLIPALLTGIYGAVCTWLGLSYHKLLKTLS